MKIDPAFLMGLLDEVSRLRALSNEESLMLEKLVRGSQRGTRKTHKWTRADDRTLLRVQHRPRGVASYANDIGVSEGAAWLRLNTLRKRLRGGDTAIGVRG